MRGKADAAPPRGAEDPPGGEPAMELPVVGPGCSEGDDPGALGGRAGARRALFTKAVSALPAWFVGREDSSPVFAKSP